MCKTNNNVSYDCKYHVIWCTKYRKPVLKHEVEKILAETLRTKADEISAEIINIEIDSDYVHLLISCDPQYGIHKVVKELKAYTSKILREEFSHLRTSMPTIWTNKYYVGTVGSVDSNTIKHYIAEQEVRTKKK